MSVPSPKEVCTGHFEKVQDEKVNATVILLETRAKLRNDTIDELLN